jgi:transposase-like protein
MDVKTPSTLKEAITHFAVPDNCVAYMAAKRWPTGVTCPTCGNNRVTYDAKGMRWQCASHHPKRKFSLKTGTILEDSPLGLDKWLPVVWLVSNCKNGVSSWEIHRSLGVTQKTAWFMLHRVRLGMQAKENTKLGGPGSEVEVDETYVGQKAKNMHKSRKARLRKTRDASVATASEFTYRYYGKTAIQGFLDREQRKVRATVIPSVKRETLQERILNQVERGSHVYTDKAVAYTALQENYIHEWVNHLETYVDGRVHTNGLENFWSLLKRGLKGTYVAVEPFHLDRYIDEQVFRYKRQSVG